MRKSQRAFTLVELLVVIGIIAVLISVLLPTLSAARRAANTVACLSNVRQLGTAALMFANDHGGYLPTASDDRWAKINDPQRKKWSYRTEATHVDGMVVYDHYSSLIPYLGGRPSQTFLTAPQDQSKVFRCPADQWMDVTDPGYMIFNNVTGGYQPISYGYNADIATLSDSTGVGRFGLSDSVGVVFGPPGPGYTGKIGQPLQCKLARVNRPAEVLLFADCGTRPPTGTRSNPLDYNDSLFYTSNWMSGVPDEDMGKLSGVAQTAWLKERIPMLRHGGKKQGPVYTNCRINVAFADGHGDTVLQGNFNKVRITPYRNR